MRNIWIILILFIAVSCKTNDTKNNGSISESLEIDSINKEEQHPELFQLQKEAYDQIDEADLKRNQLTITNDFRFFKPSRYNLTRQLDTIDGEDIEYGMFKVKEANGFTYFELRKINVKRQITIDTIIGIENEKYYTSDNDNPIYLFTGLTKNEVYYIFGKLFKNSNVLPGQVFSFKTKIASYFLYGEGNIVLRDSISFANPFQKLENLKLHIQRKMGDNFFDTVLIQMNKYPWPNGEFEQSASVEWIGDFDYDGLLDMIIGYTNHYAYYEYRFYLSTQKGNKDYFRYLISYD